MEQRLGFATAADGTKIGYAVSGDEAGTPLLHINAPGWSHALHWHELHGDVRDVLAPGRRFVWVDLRGCGVSSRDVADFSLDALAGDLEAVAGALKLPVCDIFAVGPMAPIAIRLASQRPDLVRRLVLEHPLLRDTGIFAGLRSLRTGGDFDEYLKTTAMLNVPTDQVDRILAYMRRSVDAADMNGFAESFVTWDIATDLGAVECETLVLTFARPVFSALESSGDLAALIPHGDVRVVGEWSGARRRGLEMAVAFLGRNDGPTKGGEIADGDAILSAREAEVLCLLAAGRSNPEIASLLVLSPATVAKHVHHILEKTGCANRVEASNWAREHGITRRSD